jgi:hypothetical protein
MDGYMQEHDVQLRGSEGSKRRLYTAVYNSMHVCFCSWSAGARFASRADACRWTSTTTKPSRAGGCCLRVGLSPSVVCIANITLVCLLSQVDVVQLTLSIAFPTA